MPESTGGSSTCAVLSVMVASISVLVFGLALGFTSPAIDVMQDTLKVNGKAASVPSDLVVFTSEFEGSLFSSIVNFGALAGALLGGPLSQRIGRKRAVLLQAPFNAIVWTATSFAHGFGLLILTRFFAGVGVGMCSTVVPTYINEVSPTALRGALGAVFQLACVVGIALCYLLGAYVLVVKNEDGDQLCQWRWLALTPVALSVLLFSLGLFIPESPRWLAWKQRPEAAKSALARLRGGAQHIGQELEEIHAVVRQAGGKVSCGDMLTSQRALLIGLTLMFIQQFSGVNAVIFFQDTIFMSAGLKNADSLGFMVMVVQVLMTAVSIPLMDTAGRKFLLLTACGGMLLCCLGLACFFQFFQNKGWLALVCSFGYIAFFSLGLGPVPWLMMGEVFPGKIRSSASSLAAGFNWTCSFITTETVSGLRGLVGYSGVFVIYGAFLLFGLAFIASLVPETKGRSFAEIEALLSRPRRDVPLIPMDS